MTPDEQAAALDRLNKGRLLRDASSELLPLLLKKKEDTVSAIIICFTVGNEEQLLPLAAKLSVIAELTGEITRNNRETEKKEEQYVRNTAE